MDKDRAAAGTRHPMREPYRLLRNERDVIAIPSRTVLLVLSSPSRLATRISQPPVSAINNSSLQQQIQDQYHNIF
jgi:hypothetical protein